MSNSVDNFKEAIQKYLANRLLKDELFVHTMAKPDKNVDDCITYIINTVKKSGRIAFTDSEIYSMAVHYYDENKIQVGEPIKCHIVSSTEEPEIIPDNGDIKSSATSNKPSYKQQSLFS